MELIDKERAERLSKICGWVYGMILIIGIIVAISMVFIVGSGAAYTVLGITIFVCAVIGIYETNFLRPIWDER